jgi:metal-sulfur cluster biosynthetic enzyme
VTECSEAEVMSRLRGVIDPCSAATNVPLSIVDMGMVETVEFVSGSVTIALRITSPFCHALPYFEMEIERVLRGVPGVGAVRCTFDHGADWEPGHMTDDARQKLAERREFIQSRAVNSDVVVQSRWPTKQKDCHVTHD